MVTQLTETYFRQFRTAIKGAGLGGAMCSTLQEHRFTCDSTVHSTPRIQIPSSTQVTML